MALTVEDGSGVAGADSYVSLADCILYADAQGLPFADSPPEPAESALRRATAWLDGAFRARWPGVRTHGREQALEWPRTGATDVAGNAIADDEIPVEVARACCEAAIRELATPGGLSPDVTPGKVIASAAVSGAVSVTYASGQGVEGQRPIATVIDDILSGLIGPRPARGSAVVGKAARA